MVLMSSASDRKSGKPASPVTKKSFWPTSTCRGCHDQIVEQHLASSHEMSFTNPVFQAQYRKDLLPRAATDQQFYEDALQCIACHQPVAYATNRPKPVSLLDIDPKMNGVTCDIVTV